MSLIQKIFQPNRVIFERAECAGNPKFIPQNRCTFKPVGPNILSIDIFAKLIRSLKNVQLHATVYYSYNGITFTKFPIDVWESLCDYHKGKWQPIIEMFYYNLRPFWNVNHPCPYSDNITLHIDKYAINDFSVGQILPSGRYRFFANLTEGRKRDFVWSIQLFIEISDHRVHGF